jgi:hypothetical protein
MIFKTPKQIRVKEIGKTTFATGRVHAELSLQPKTCGNMRHMRHEMREHNRERY